MQTDNDALRKKDPKWRLGLDHTLSGSNLNNPASIYSPIEHND